MVIEAVLEDVKLKQSIFAGEGRGQGMGGKGG
jgi:hypothetical protein